VHGIPDCNYVPDNAAQELNRAFFYNQVRHTQTWGTWHQLKADNSDAQEAGLGMMNNIAITSNTILVLQPLPLTLVHGRL
jgi:hypothetical protein